MAEAAGLAIGAIALASLATDCIECFDIIELTKTYSRDFEILETSLEAQKVRLIIWLQANGLAGSIPYNTTLDEYPVRGSIDRALKCIKLLFEDSEALRRKYGLLAIDSDSASASITARPRIPVFNETYRNFRARLRNTQRSATIARRTRWAIHDKNKFKNLIDDLKSMIDVVEDITQSAEQLQRRRELITAEVDSIMDEEHLQLVQEVASLTIDDDLSSAASQRMRLLANTNTLEQASLVGTINNTVISNETFYSAHSHASRADNIMIPMDIDGGDQTRLTQQLQIAAQELLGDHQDYPLVPPERERYRQRFENEARACLEMLGLVPGSNTWHSRSSGRAKRIARELSRSQDDLPLLSYMPVEADNLNSFIGYFLGPIDTPYEGGMFYVRIHISSDYPFKPPVCQLLTRVYHPNIDANGRICLDFLYDQWGPWAEIKYTMLCIQTLLDTPDTDDALVPEIAATYINNRAEYDRNARLYTTKYATGKEPVLLRDSGSDEARPWWETARIRARG